MKTPLSIMLVAAALLGSFQATPRQTGAAGVTVIVGATIIDGTGSEPQRQTVIINGERIEAVGSGLAIPEGARVINGEGMTVVPGLFDLHTHLPYATASGISGDWPKNLKSYLYCGVTSVVDFGTYPETFEPMRRLIREGKVISPRLSLAARLTTPGGHGAEGGRGDFFSQEVSTATEARAALERLIPYQPDVIKVFTDGWRYGNAPDMTSMNEETLTALVENAHGRGWEVLTHTVRLENVRIAARAGVDVIAHGVNDRQVDRELIDLMKARGTTYVSTLAVYEPRGREILTPLLRRVLDPVVLAAIRPPLTPPTGGETIPIPPSNIAPGPETPSRQRRWYNLQNNLGQLNRAGVRIGAGTDAGVVGTHHGWGTIRELELMVAGGMTPLEVLTAATGNSARALGVASERGTIAPGRLADLLIIEGEPHRRINEITRIRHLFLSGREIEREELARQIAMPELTPLPTTPASASLDDFERSDNRSTIDTRWVYGSDAGVDPSKVIFGRIARHPNSASLLATARLSIKERPFIRMILPLRRGGVEPVDASKFSGVKFEVRGGGDYRLVIPTYQVRDLNHFAAPFQATSDWTTVTIPFSALRRNDKSPESGPGWTARDLVAIGFEMAGRSGELRWIELDNIRLY